MSVRVILLVLLVFAVLPSVFAEEVVFSVFAPKKQSQNTYAYVSQSPVQVNLGSVQVFLEIEADVTAYIDDEFASVSLCVRPQGGTDACQPLRAGGRSGGFFGGGTRSEHQTVRFSFSPFAAGVLEFYVRGSSQYYGGYYAYLNRIEWLGGQGQIVRRDLSSLGGTAPVPLGAVRSFVSQQPGPEGIVAFSSDPRAVVWFNDVQGGGVLSPTSRNKTSHPDDQVLACLNSDLNRDSLGNPRCDYVDENECASRNRDWFAGNCCGDAPYAACGFYQDKQALCGQDGTGRFLWAPLSDVGKIVRLQTCPQVDVVSSGQKFYSCGQPSGNLPNIERFQGKLSIAGHEYACDGDVIVECGGLAPKSQGAKRPGETLSIGGVVHTCAADGLWKQSFDGDRASCESAGFAWTGTRCCGEKTDVLSSYEDEYNPAAGGVPGACFKGQFVPSGGFVSGNRNILNHRGKFYVCEPNPQQQSSALQLFAGTGITPVVSSACGLPLQNSLLQGSLVHAVCTPEGVWDFVARTDEHTVKSARWQVSGAGVRSGCCPLGECWDGTRCRARGEYQIVGVRGFRCR